jgi:hypothetical protein
MPERASIGALKDGASRDVVHLDRTDGAYAFLDDWSEGSPPVAPGSATDARRTRSRTSGVWGSPSAREPAEHRMMSLEQPSSFDSWAALLSRPAGT